jgi:hypothetical protein
MSESIKGFTQLDESWACRSERHQIDPFGELEFLMSWQWALKIVPTSQAFTNRSECSLLPMK